MRVDENQKDIKSFAQFLFSIPPAEFALLSSIIGVIIAAPLELMEQQSIGNFLVSTGQSILTYYSQKELILQNRIEKFNSI